MLNFKNVIASVLLVAGSLVSSIAQADIIVSFDPDTSMDVNVGDSFSINLLADASATGSDAFFGWGLDLNFDSSILMLENTTIGSLFLSTSGGADGDGLGGASNSGFLSGSNILLATLTFKALGVGFSDLFTSSTLGDPNEGFSGFQAINFSNTPLAITVKDVVNGQVPEPASLALFVIAAFGLLSVRRKA